MATGSWLEPERSGPTPSATQPAPGVSADVTGTAPDTVGDTAGDSAPVIRRRARRLVVATIAAVTVGTATAAYAYYSASGTVSGTVQLGTTPTFTATGTAVGLFPGGSATVALTLDRTGLPGLEVQAVTGPSGGVTVQNAPGCAGANSATTVNWSGVATFPAGLVTTINLPAAVSMGTGAANACQGATLRIPVNVTAVQ